MTNKNGEFLHDPAKSHCTCHPNKSSKDLFGPATSVFDQPIIRWRLAALASLALFLASLLVLVIVWPR